MDDRPKKMSFINVNDVSERALRALGSGGRLLFGEGFFEVGEDFQSFFACLHAFVAFGLELAGEEGVFVEDFAPEFQFLGCPIVEFGLRAFFFGRGFEEFGVAGVELVDFCEVPCAFDDGFVACSAKEDAFDDGEPFLAF